MIGIRTCKQENEFEVATGVYVWVKLNNRTGKGKLKARHQDQAADFDWPIGQIMPLRIQQQMALDFYSSQLRRAS